MKNYFKFITVVAIIVLSGFIFSAISKNSNSKKDIALATKTSVNKIEKSFLIGQYSEVKTEKVHHKLDSLLKRINKRFDFNGSLLVSKKGKIVYSEQVGYANFRKKEFLNDSSVFQLASVSKQFTAAAIMLLYERNQIKLTDTVTNYFPNFPYEGVTIKNLLNHTAGLPKYFWVSEHNWKKEKVPNNSEVMELLESSNVLRFFKPGGKFKYSNTGYFVLASIVEKVSGTSFSAFVKNNIFDPLEMNDSFVYSFEKDPIKTNQLSGYRLYRGWRHQKVNSSIHDAVVGDKNVYATSKDLLKWTLALNKGKLLSAESVKLMYTKGTTNYGKEVPYGFGFRIDNDDESTIYHHGKWNGFSTGLTQYPEDDLVIVILEHSSYSGISTLNNTVKKLVEDNFHV